MTFGIIPTLQNKKIYSKEQFFIFVERDKSEIAQKLNRFRVDLVNKYLGPDSVVLDIGIGAGTFMDLRGNCLGFDINPYAVKKLKKAGRFFDPYKDDYKRASVKGVTFFDSFEHINNPAVMLNRMRDQIVFVSIPIFYNKKHMLTSRHFKPGEHVWHFTKRQFESYVKMCGFLIVEERRDETDIGRSDIRTFVLQKA